MAFKNGFNKKNDGKSFGRGSSNFDVARSAMNTFAQANRSRSHAPNPGISRFASNTSSTPRHLRNNYSTATNTAANIVGNVSRSLLTNNKYCRHSSFGDAMGNALGSALSSAIVMSVRSKIQEKQQEYQDKKAAEALAAQQAAEAAEQAKKEAAFHAMNKNMPNYDEEAMVHLMDGAGLTEEEKANYPLKCPHCLGVPDGTRYCPYCGGKLV